MPFRVGEKFLYKIRWGIMPVGYSSMSIDGTISCGSQKKCLILKTEARGNKAIQAVFPVKDKIISYWEPVEKRPYYSEKDLNEGFYHRHNVVLYDHLKHLASWGEKQFSGNTGKKGEMRKDARWKYKKGETKNLPSDFQDFLSAIYYTRADKRKGKKGDIFYLTVFDDLKIVKMKMEILEVEEIELEVDGLNKKYTAVVSRPYISTSGMFLSKGEVKIWVSNDDKKIPLKITSKIPYLGHVTVELISTKF
ncbi:MAG: DUF3108 domain-containing protein [Leptospiraceae bacterium]|nr:DUF3108 domain-containing protein [Leptospiraceae bacterium]